MLFAVSHFAGNLFPIVSCICVYYWVAGQVAYCMTKSWWQQESRLVLREVRASPVHCLHLNDNSVPRWAYLLTMYVIKASTYKSVTSENQNEKWAMQPSICNLIRTKDHSPAPHSIVTREPPQFGRTAGLEMETEIPYLSFLPPAPFCTFDVGRAVANLMNNELWINMFSLASIANMVLIICQASSFEPVHQQGV